VQLKWNQEQRVLKRELDRANMGMVNLTPTCAMSGAPSQAYGGEARGDFGIEPEIWVMGCSRRDQRGFRLDRVTPTRSNMSVIECSPA
jgi:hypothetical protein